MMSFKTEIHQSKQALSGTVIDYSYYERRARCLRASHMLKWLSGRDNRKKYSSDESLCG